MIAAARLTGNALVLLGGMLAVIPVAIIYVGDWILRREEARHTR